MATPRKKYFRVFDEIARVPWDNDQVAAYTRLSGFMNTQWARDALSAEDAGRAILRKDQLCGITGKGRLDAARRSLERLAEVESISFEYRADITLVEWPNFPTSQNYRSETGEEPGTKTAPSATRDPRPATRDPQKNVAPPEWASRLAQGLAEKVTEKEPGASVPSTLACWAGEIARIERSEAEIAAVIDWLFSSANTGKYAFVVLSARALREKYGRIRSRMRRSQPKPTAPFGAVDERTRTYMAEGDNLRRRVQDENPEHRAREIAETRERWWRKPRAEWA